MTGLIVSTSGCTKFLDLKPKGKDVPRTFSHYDGLLNSTRMLQMIWSAPNPNGTGYMFSKGLDPFWMFMTDEIIAPTPTEFDLFGKEQKEAFKFADDILIYTVDEMNTWSGLYSFIFTNNVIINNVPALKDGSEADRQALVAEAKVNRAHFHHLLAQTFGKPYRKATEETDLAVPLVTEASIGILDYKRNTNKELYDFIIKDLKESIPLLKEGVGTKLRVHRAAGYFVLGRILFDMGLYSEALEALKSCQTESAKAVIPIALFDYTDDSKSFSLWGYNSATPHAWRSGYFLPEDAKNTEIINASYFTQNIVIYTGTQLANAIFVKDEYMAKFSPNDRRRRFFADRRYTGTPVWGRFKRINKWQNPYGANLPDLYLMLAECYARTGNETLARETVMLLRSKRIVGATEAAIPASVNSKDLLIKFIVEERLRENMMTGMRWFDIRRLWNDPLFPEIRTNSVHTLGTETYTLTREEVITQNPSKGFENVSKSG
ncbi:RagB/SusD family nutrient uptake outer membrane protein [Bacteroidota bacterium]